MSVFDSATDPTPRSDIDRAVLSRLKREKIAPARICSDGVFVRRAFLDAIGTLPTAKEARKFLLSPDPKKRSKLIDELLQRDEYADYWAMRWSDVLRIKAEFPINLWPNAAKAYYRWVHTCFRDNVPYDRFARDLLTSSGSNFRVPPVNFYRAVQSNKPEALAGAVALTLLGARAAKWPKKRLAGLAAFFDYVGFKRTHEWKEEIIYFDSIKAAKDAAAGKLPTALLPDAAPVKLTGDRDPRRVLADWLITDTNEWFSRAIVNRMWFWLMGRGVIHEPDDIREDNPPSNPELLAVLRGELVAAHWDLKELIRRIMTSATYQLSPVPRSKDPRAAALFAHYSIRRLDAEVLIDALDQITDSTESYRSMIPEPFTFVPASRRTIALPDGSITSSFLELFGRPPRDTGLLTERNYNPTAAQVLHMLNSSHVRNKIQRSERIKSLMRTARRNPKLGISALYLTILSRFPSDAEYEAVKAYGQRPEGKGAAAVEDLTWALFNSSEFVYRH